MSMRPIFAMVRKDLQLFFTDRRAVIMTMVAPIAIASFFGSIFSGNSGEPARIEVAIVDQDSSPISKGILSGAQGDRNLHVTTPSADEARAQVKGACRRQIRTPSTVYFVSLSTHRTRPFNRPRTPDSGWYARRV